MSAPDPISDDKPNLVDVIHEWLGQSGLRKIWGIESYGAAKSDFDWLIPAKLFLRENDVPYFNVWPTYIADSGDYKRAIEMHDPEFFEKLRKMLDEREGSRTIICRCSKCEGTKL